MPPPMPSISFSHDRPEKSEKPTANNASRTSVAPLKPRNRARPCPTTSPSAPPGANGRLAGSVVQPQGLDCGTRDEHEPEAENPERQRVVGRELGVADATIAHDHQHQPRDHPPPGGESEEVQEQIRKPRAGDAAAIGDRFTGAGERPAGSVRV